MHVRLPSELRPPSERMLRIVASIRIAPIEAKKVSRNAQRMESLKPGHRSGGGLWMNDVSLDPSADAKFVFALSFANRATVFSHLTSFRR